MINENTVMVGRVNIERIEEAGKADFIISMRENYCREMPERISNFFQDSSIESFSLTLEGKDKPLGLALIRKDSKKENGMQIVLDFFETPGEESVRQIINTLIGNISQNSGTEYISVKVEENNALLEGILVQMGFLKDGLFISNHLSGEFVYYNVYTYKLI